MNASASHQELGRFIVTFQHVETALTRLLVLMAKADDEAVRILVNELQYSQRVKTTDVLFARFVDLLCNPDYTAKAEFHKLMNELWKLGERRNEMVHSKYASWISVEGRSGLLRENSRLRASKGAREEEEEELLPESFAEDFRRLSEALNELERFRLKVIDWLCPDV
ncbi:MAG: hypothetical protein LBE81_00705 [Azonexus sp.]|jgi:hypothetical protein|uniref:hypothetical protein n=1 Tax=Azonexus sp. TaxID=1872668 RepID=UPI00281B1F6D|nr:hypothetical protein [Azonexus sp.]MDR0775146.1 hypothetical protein [Azonexus sp.]